MRVFGRLFVLTLIAACPLLAKADGVDFNMNVQDPDPPTYTVITNPSFNFSFGECDLGELADGCFYGENQTGEVLTSLTFDIPDTGYLLQTSQTAGCSTGGGYFDDCSVGTAADGDFIVTFFGGSGIPFVPDRTNPQAPLFDVTECDDVDMCSANDPVLIDPSTAYQNFPTNISVTANAPEPSSLLLLGTGLLCVAGLWFKGFVKPGREERN